QSATRNSTSRSRKAERTRSEASTVRSLNLHVRHQSAVKSTKTGLPLARAECTASGLHARASALEPRASPASAAEGGRPAPTATRIAAAAVARPSQRPAPAARWASPRDQQAKATTTRKATKRPMASTPPSPPITQASQAAVPSRAKPRKCLKCSIQAPGLGRRAASPGKSTRRQKGAASPSPNTKKTSAIVADEAAKAKPTAVPRSGAEQGVASTTASTPSPAADRESGEQ